MRISVEAKGNFEHTISWLKKLSKLDTTKILKQVGQEGVDALRNATPIGPTGQTANGWEYKIEQGRNYAELYFVNNSHPEAQVNIAKILDLGHGTGTGGYVPPRRYISRALQPVFSKVSNLLDKEVSR